MRVLTDPDTPMPEVQLLSNGRYHVMVTNAGGGYSRWKDLAVTRWREDTHPRQLGQRSATCATSTAASSGRPRTSRRCEPAEHYEAIFSEGRAEFRRRDHDIETHTEIVVSPEDDIELRRVRITNRIARARTIEVTSYAEVVLAPAAADALHPAFSNLFVQTEIVARRAGDPVHAPAALARRAPAVDVPPDGRARRRRRRRCRTRPTACASSAAAARSPRRARCSSRGALSGSEGSVLDPIVAIRHRVTLEPEQTATIDMVTGVGDTRDGVPAA